VISLGLEQSSERIQEVSAQLTPQKTKSSVDSVNSKKNQSLLCNTSANMFKSRAKYPNDNKATTASELTFKLAQQPVVADELEPEERTSPTNGGCRVGNLVQYGQELGTDEAKTFFDSNDDLDKREIPKQRTHSAEISLSPPPPVTPNNTPNASNNPNRKKGFMSNFNNNNNKKSGMPPRTKTELVLKTSALDNNCEEDDYNDFVLEVKSLDDGKTHRVVGGETNGLANLTIGERRRLSSGGVVLGERTTEAEAPPKPAQQIEDDDELLFNLKDQPYSASDEKEEDIVKHY